GKVGERRVAIGGGGYVGRRSTGGDADALAGVLKRLLDDAGARRAAGEAAARYVRERSGATQVVAEHVLHTL
ncbi:MAG TPA: hypothetical protein PLN54_04765, partial [Flavobacteriales bacterium]|nr:hypothetical protein [Flavobacteriales bacterium]